MTAIQRWYFCPFNGRMHSPEGVPPDQQWCKAKDVESLEALVLQYTSILSALRTEVLQLRLDRQCEHDLRVKLAGELEHATCHIESLQAELTDANVEVWKARVRAS